MGKHEDGSDSVSQQRPPLGSIPFFHQAYEGKDRCLYCGKFVIDWRAMELCHARDRLLLYLLLSHRNILNQTRSLVVAAADEWEARHIAYNYSKTNSEELRQESKIPFSPTIGYHDPLPRSHEENPDIWFTVATCFPIGLAGYGMKSGIVLVDTLEIS